jgi:type IV pilus assembly protein PilY1
MRMFSNTDGQEVWGFIPRAVMPVLKRLKDNTVGTPIHPVTVDGAPVAYMEDQDGNGNIESGDKVYVYFGLRRGGTSYYALDISDRNTPQLLWVIKKGDTGFEELGQTWSTPRVGKIRYTEGSTPKTEPVLIFGGGYDTNKDRSSTPFTGGGDG